MFLVTVLIVLVAEALNIWSTLSSWKDFANGRPHIDSLRDVTWIIDRSELIAQFGPPNASYRFQTDLQTALSRARPWGRVFDNPFYNGVAIALVLAALLIDQPLAWVIVASVGAYCLLGWGVSLAATLPYLRQFADED